MEFMWRVSFASSNFRLRFRFSVPKPEIVLQIHSGIKGLVIDGETGEPVKVRLIVDL